MVINGTDGPPRKVNRTRQKKVKRHNLSSPAGNKVTYDRSKYSKKDMTFAWGPRNAGTDKKRTEHCKGRDKKFK